MPVIPLRRFLVPPARTRLARALWCALWLALAAGCGAKANANGPAIPALAVPEPPPRVFPTEDGTTLADVTTSPKGPIAVSAGAPDLPAPVGRTPVPEQARRESTPPVSPAPAPQEPARELNPARAAEEAAQQKQIETILDTATTALKRIVSEKLTKGNKEQYEDANRYVEEARKALKEGRLIYARANADKAQTIAQQLAPR